VKQLPPSILQVPQHINIDDND